MKATPADSSLGREFTYTCRHAKEGGVADCLGEAIR